MLRLLFTVMVCLFFVSTVIAQTIVPEVDPEMIQISFDGVDFSDASSYLSDISVSVGTVSGVHGKNTKYGNINIWEGQLGTPYTEYKLTFNVDTLIIPPTEREYYIRFQYKVEKYFGSGTYVNSPFSFSSNAVRFVGKPGKPNRN